MFTQAKTQLSTVRDLLRFAVSRFNEANLFSATALTTLMTKRLISFCTACICRSIPLSLFSMPG